MGRISSICNLFCEHLQPPKCTSVCVLLCGSAGSGTLETFTV